MRQRRSTTALSLIHKSTSVRVETRRRRTVTREPGKPPRNFPSGNHCKRTRTFRVAGRFVFTQKGGISVPWREITSRLPSRQRPRGEAFVTESSVKAAYSQAPRWIQRMLVSVKSARSPNVFFRSSKARTRAPQAMAAGVRAWTDLSASSRATSRSPRSQRDAAAKAASSPCLVEAARFLIHSEADESSKAEPR